MIQTENVNVSANLIVVKKTFPDHKSVGQSASKQCSGDVLDIVGDGVREEKLELEEHLGGDQTKENECVCSLSDVE
jgi:hypothetical protein